MFNLTKHTALNHQPASAKKPQFLQQGMAPFAWGYGQRLALYMAHSKFCNLKEAITRYFAVPAFTQAHTGLRILYDSLMWNIGIMPIPDGK
jgi:hypothetical protein